MEKNVYIAGIRDESNYIHYFISPSMGSMTLTRKHQSAKRYKRYNSAIAGSEHIKRISQYHTWEKIVLEVAVNEIVPTNLAPHGFVIYSKKKSEYLEQSGMKFGPSFNCARIYVNHKNALNSTHLQKTSTYYVPDAEVIPVRIDILNEWTFSEAPVDLVNF